MSEGMIVATYVAGLGVAGWLLIQFYNLVQNFTRAIATFEEAIKRIDISNDLRNRACERHTERTDEHERQINEISIEIARITPMKPVKRHIIK